MAYRKQCRAEARAVAEEIAAAHGFTLAVLRERVRNKARDRTRCRIMHDLSGRGYSHGSIGELLGRDRTTVLSGARSHAEWLKNPVRKRKPRRRRFIPTYRPPTRAQIKAKREAAQVQARLLFQYGPERAAIILAGNDPATNADIAKWKSLGEPKVRAHKERAGL